MLLKGQIYSKYWNNPIFRLKNNPTPNSSQFLIRQDIGNNCLQSNFLTIVVKLFIYVIKLFDKYAKAFRHLSKN